MGFLHVSSGCGDAGSGNNSLQGFLQEKANAAEIKENIMNPFAKKRPNPKRWKPRRTKEERLHGAAKTARRREIFERSGGRCEAEIPGAILFFGHESHILTRRCNRPITWGTFHWSHNRHAANKSDSMSGGIASCAECHRRLHNPKSCKRRPGKQMSKKDAEAYWRGKVCFCETTPKRPYESFCPDCRMKVTPAILHVLEKTDDPDVYREYLALAENAILTWKPEEREA